MDLNNILEIIKEENLLAIRFEQTDTNGIARSKLVLARHFKEKATKGLNFVLCHLAFDVQLNVLAPNTGYAEEIGFADAVMFPIFESFQVLPWLKRTGRILIEPTWKGSDVEGHPRVVARRQLEKLRQLGISLYSAHEHEFYVVDKETKKPLNEDKNAHSAIRDTPYHNLLNKFMEYLPKVGVDVELVENEYGPGQLEISYKPAFGISAADNAHTYKTSIKEIAILNGYMASFMSKPYPNKSGSSSHFNHSLWDINEKVPLLYDANDPLSLSETGQHWIAGILAHAPAIEVLMAPTVNCLTRVTPHAFAPINATWGFDNRTCDIRVKINGPEGTYIEHRAGAAGCNPYLSLAATVAAGIDGIVNKLKLPPQVTGDACEEADIPPKTANLPANMEDALTALTNDETICDALGKDFIKCFTAVKKCEAKQAREAEARGDKDWAFNFYFEYL
ncbi:lengsin-like [Lytechinus pictus]|uniref:lengsin-like n=1 Tax=Lytechinus pictus TaxID=7653 RepID=UPI00240DD23D|nr:lengsin-like [Lytechinus pictus]